MSTWDKEYDDDGDALFNDPSKGANSQKKLDFIGGYKILAQNKYSLVMGANNAITLGQWSSLKAGATFSGTLGVAFSSFTGIKTDLKLAHCDFTIDKKKFVTAEMKAAAEEATLAANRLDLISEGVAIANNKLLGVATALNLHGQQIQTATNNITTNTNSLNFETNRVNTIVNQVGAIGTQLNNVDAELSNVSTKVEAAGVILADHEASLQSAGINIVEADMTMLG